MDCEEAAELVDAYALGVLERQQGRGLEQHLSGCAGCRSALYEAEGVVGSLALAAPLRRAGPALRLRLLSRLGAPTGRPGWESRRRTPLPNVWAAAAAVLLALLLGALGWNAVLQVRVSDLQTDNSRFAGLVNQGKEAQVSLVATQEALLSKQRRLEAAVEEQEEALVVALDNEARPYDMLGTGPAAQAWASYVWSAQHHMGVLYAANLPALPSGMTYQLWLITEERPIDGGTFAPDDHGSARLLVRDPAVRGRVVAIAVSLEPEGGSSAPTGATVLRGEPPGSE